MKNLYAIFNLNRNCFLHFEIEIVQLETHNQLHYKLETPLSTNNPIWTTECLETAENLLLNSAEELSSSMSNPENEFINEKLEVRVFTSN